MKSKPKTAVKSTAPSFHTVIVSPTVKEIQILVSGNNSSARVQLSGERPEKFSRPARVDVPIPVGRWLWHVQQQGIWQPLFVIESYAFAPRVEIILLDGRPGEDIGQKFVKV